MIIAKSLGLLALLFLNILPCDEYVIIRRMDDFPMKGVTIGRKTNTFLMHTEHSSPYLDTDVIKLNFTSTVRDIVLDYLEHEKSSVENLFTDNEVLDIMKDQKDQLNKTGNPYDQKLLTVLVCFDLSKSNQVHEVYFSVFNMPPFLLLNQKDLNEVENEIRSKITATIDSSLLELPSNRRAYQNNPITGHWLRFSVRDLINVERGILSRDSLKLN